MHLKNLEPPLNTTNSLQARWTFGLSASASILIFGCCHHHLQIEALSKSKSSAVFFSRSSEHLGLMTHQLINIIQTSVLLKSKYNIKNPRDTEYTDGEDLLCCCSRCPS